MADANTAAAVASSTCTRLSLRRSGIGVSEGGITKDSRCSAVSLQTN
jgi:hypothetical protein